MLTTNKEATEMNLRRDEEIQVSQVTETTILVSL